MKNYFIIFNLLTALLILISQTLTAQLGLPLTKNYTPKEYNGGIQNWQILQDSRGIVYVANNFGLLQYDGNDWRNYYRAGSSKLRSMALGSNGRLYVGYQSDFGYFEADSLGSLVYYSLKEKIPFKYQDIEETWKTYVINDKVYFCTFNNIYIYHQEEITVTENHEKLDISYASNNQLYTYIPEHGLHLVEEDSIVPIPITDSFKDKTVSGLISINFNELLITTFRNGIYITDHTEVKPWHEELNTLFSKTFINCAILLSNGNIVLGTQHNGIYIINQNGDIILHLNKERGLLSRTILSLYEDHNNNLWVGQNNGISFIELKSPFTKINEEAGLPGTGYTALQKEEQLYFGTNNGVFTGDGETIQLIKGSEGQVYNIQSINNDILIGHNDGAFVIKNQIATPFDNNIGTWMFLPLGDVLLQGTYEGIKVLGQKNYTELGKISALTESSRILTLVNDNTVWMSHGYKGLYKIQLDKKSIFDSKVKFYNENNGLPSNTSNTAYIIEGDLIVTTQDGIYSYDQKSDNFKLHESFNEHFINQQVNTLNTDIYGNIYFVTTSTLGFLEKLTNNEYKKHEGPFHPIRNLLNDDLSNINIISPNLVLFGAKEGFVLFDRNLFWTTEKETFQTIIRQVQSIGVETTTLYYGNGQNQKISPEQSEGYPKISYANNTVSLYFSSTSFSSTINPEFKFKLNGFDKDWHDWTQSNFKEYTNLREGFYTFQVKSKNASNVESAIETYSFMIIYPWYRSPIAYIIYVILAISTLIGIIMSLDKRHQLEKKKLEQKRLQELSEKEEQLDTITKQSKDEINQLRNEKLESEIKHRDTELATSTMHLLNKNEFIDGIKSTLSGVIKKSSNNEVKGIIQSVIKNIEKNIQTDGDWQNFQIHFDKVHGDFSHRIKDQYPTLSPQEIKLSAYLRLNLSTKEIANLLNISVRGVEIARYRLRKKLNLERNQNLAEFILNY